MISPRTKWLCLLCWSLVTGGIQAAPPLAGRLPLAWERTTLEDRLLADAADGRLDEWSLLEAGLIASGATEEIELIEGRRWFDQCRGDLVERLSADLAPPQVADRILRFLHERHLQHYDLRANDLRRSLRDGSFNCITAVLWFNALAQVSGLEAVAVELPGHVISRIRYDRHTLDIEATVEPSELTYTAARVQSQGSARELSALGLVALVYYNRALDLLDRREFESAVAAHRMALTLDPASTNAAENLLAALNNWALDRYTVQDFRTAYDLLRVAHGVAPSDVRPVDNARAVVGPWLDQLCSQGFYEQAFDLIARADADGLLDSTERHAACVRVLRVQFSTMMADKTPPQAARTCDELYSSGQPAAALDEAEIAAWNDRATWLDEQGRRSEALAWLQFAVARFPQSELLQSSLHQLSHHADDLSTRPQIGSP